MMNFNFSLRYAVMCLGAFALLVCSVGLRAQTATVQYTLPSDSNVIYPAAEWLPSQYKSVYVTVTVEDTIADLTKKSLAADRIQFTDVTVKKTDDGYLVNIINAAAAAKAYPIAHSKFISNYQQALIGINKCKQISGCWNKNADQDVPWAFFPQFGLPMVLQRGVMLLNYPPITALTQPKNGYLGTFTMERWTRVLQRVGAEFPSWYETIVDVRPIAAKGSNTSQNLPDAVTYFNDQTGKTGGYYITPQLNLMLDPLANSHAHTTVPLVVLGTPAREAWSKVANVADTILSTGTVTLPGAQKSTPYIMGNHPDVTTYQCCPGDTSPQCTSNDLIASEEIDVQIACWVIQQSIDPSMNPEEVLANCKKEWTERSSADNRTFCALARIDSNECFGKNLQWDDALAYCDKNQNNPCATTACPVP